MKNETEAERIARLDREAIRANRTSRALHRTSKTARATAAQEDWDLARKSRTGVKPDKEGTK